MSENTPLLGASSPLARRRDIQAMRGLAVGVVVLYHSGLGIFAGGYLGVDIFFVVSGFLITSIILRDMNASNFNFSDFYSRRARRLLPAVYVTLLLVIIAATFFLTSTKFNEFTQQVTGTVTFTSNIFLYFQTGYFSTRAAYVPLLHTWSLSIEEQYYLFFPILMLLISTRYRGVAVAVITLVSIVACFNLVARSPSLTFFATPTRAWELGFGSLGAFFVGFRRIEGLALILAVPALAICLFLPFFPLSSPHPGISALLVCLATLILMLAKAPWIERSPLIQPMAALGDISYSLYLVHWPILAFAHVLLMSETLSPVIALPLIVLSVLLSILMYRYVEQPIRHSAIHGGRLLAYGVGGALGIIALTAGIGSIKETMSPVEARPTEAMLTLSVPECFSEGTKHYDGTCTESDAPEILIWGDSYTGHLTPGLTETTDRPVAQASKGHCGPFSNYAVVATPNELGWTKGCISFNHSVMEYLSKTPSIEVVALSANFVRYLDGTSHSAITGSGATFQIIEAGTATSVPAMVETVKAVRALGKRIVIIGPTPESKFDHRECWQREREGLPILRNNGCIFSLKDAADVRSGRIAFMEAVETDADVDIIDLEDILCPDGTCITQKDGHPLFLDHGHLNMKGSLLVGRNGNLGTQVWDRAR